MLNELLRFLCLITTEKSIDKIIRFTWLADRVPD